MAGCDNSCPERQQSGRIFFVKRANGLNYFFASPVESRNILSRRPSIKPAFDGYVMAEILSRKFGSSPREGGFHGAADWRYRPGFRSRDDRRQNPLPRLDRQQLGRAVLPSQGFHAGLHHRAGHHGAPQARVRQARRQDHRAFGRPGRQPQEVVRRHQGRGRLRPELSR